MQKKSSVILIGVILVFTIMACSVTINRDSLSGETISGSGEVAEENRTIGNISRVEFNMPGTLHITVGDSETLRIEAEENLLEYIQTEVSGGKLVIETRRGTSLRSNEPINFYLTVDELDGIVGNSSGNVEAGDLQSGSFSVTINSSGKVSISQLQADKLTVLINSSGDLEIAGGQVQQQTITNNSSGEYNARDLASVEARVTLQSSGSATIRVSDRLSGSLSSSGNVNYIGNPEVDVSTSSSGEALQVDE